MKMTKSMVYVKSHEARELVVYTANDARFYNSIKAVIKSLQKKVINGTYESSKAVISWYNIANIASKQYFNDYGYQFSVTERFTAAVDLEEYFQEDVFEIDE